MTTMRVARSNDWFAVTAGEMVQVKRRFWRNGELWIKAVDGREIPDALLVKVTPGHPSRGAHDLLGNYGWGIAASEGATAVYVHTGTGHIDTDRGRIIVIGRDPAVPWSAIRWTHEYPARDAVLSDSLASLETHLIYDARIAARTTGGER